MTIREDDFSFYPTQKERFHLQASRLPVVLGNPVPESMQGVRMEDLVAEDIHWKMLTHLRPICATDEGIFNLLVSLGAGEIHI